MRWFVSTAWHSSWLYILCPILKVSSPTLKSPPTKGRYTLDGASGNDILVGGAGDDKLIGGIGNDTVSYAIDTAGINVSLRLLSGIDGYGDTDIYDTIENILGSSHDDIIEGNATNNTLDGGAGIDTISFENAVAGVTVDLSITTAQSTGNDGTDKIVNFENLTGTNQIDNLTGDANTNIINGLNGNDIIDGAGGVDSLYGYGIRTGNCN